MHLLVIVANAFNQDIPGMHEITMDGVVDIYQTGVIECICNEYKTKLYNIPDVYEIPETAESYTMCNCSDRPEIKGDTFVNIQHKASSLMSSSKKKLDEFEDLISNVKKTDVCVAYNSVVYDAAIACWAFPPIVHEIKDYAATVFTNIIKKLAPTMTIIISQYSVKGVDSAEKGVRQYNGKYFKMVKSQSSNDFALESGKPSGNSSMIISQDPGVDMIFTDDINEIIKASLGLRDPIYDIENIVDYDTIIMKHLESFGYD